MEFRLCIACGDTIPESCKSCQCGHVLTETRTIAGKRFSDYRAELYTRLVIEESRRQARKPRAKRIPTSGPRIQQERERTKSPNIFRGRKRKRRSRSLLLKGNTTAKTDQMRVEQNDAKSTDQNTGDSYSQQSVQTRKSFTSALAEINKRLRNQSRLWACLSSGLPLGANT